MKMNGVYVVQHGNAYYIYTEQNICLGAVQMPPNGQLLYDHKILEVITKALAARWGIIKNTGRRK